jgi:ribosomal protein S18 acetylase RimI-like enzyme
MSLRLRLATAADVSHLIEMRRDFYCHDPASLNDERDRKVLEVLLGNPSLGRIWMVEVESSTVGFAIVTFCYSIEFGGRFALLDELYLSSASRGQGLGTEVLKQIEAAMQSENISALRLEVNRANGAAERLYRRAGFETDDRNLMTKWLNRD